MKLAADISGLVVRFIGSDGSSYQPAQLAVMQQQPEDQAMPEPDPIREEPVQSPPHEDPLPQHPPHVYHAVRLTKPLEPLLHRLPAQSDEILQDTRRRPTWETRVERRLDRLEDVVQWTVALEHARRDKSQLPSFPEPRVYTDDGSSAGPSEGT
ncbi:hypothetical protein E3N88_28561 [Mikania micrantha]|uniref:Uncharacterized protein n=1 Tax=Mikania micrantha TaxID=192012 RepID=A0A5N6N101_9ASTR|nr:hypothetical protein E3N88_28561 [Mikania micrantha]